MVQKRKQFSYKHALVYEPPAAYINIRFIYFNSFPDFANFLGLRQGKADFITVNIRWPIEVFILHKADKSRPSI